jgi:peptidoglycan/LPS O-acetylase OafA/YrhL
VGASYFHEIMRPIDSTPYRADIDGLRAIAVLSVIIFHAFPAFLQGGFVGVDIFFVISGFLITSIILKQAALNTFSLSHFYANRIRRIFPALLLVLLFSLSVGWISLTADEYKQLGLHTAGGALFIDNFIFWRESGYFDNPAATKPLLHLWSLAIEEQFYLVWPLVLLFLSKFGRSFAHFFTILILASLAYSAWIADVNPTADFFSPLTRAWELLLGGLLAHALLNNFVLSKSQQSIASFAGLLLIVIALLLINEASAFPGLWALLPTLGALLLIWSKDSYVNQKILAHPVLVAIGLMSYPLYLWHWPLLIFARIFEGETPTVFIRALLLLASFILAWATYQLIEKPIRFSKRSTWLIATLSILMLITFAAGLTVKDNRGFKFRNQHQFNADPATMVIGADRVSHKRGCGLEHLSKEKIEWCTHDNKQAIPNFVVLGDSKGEALFFGLSRESNHDESWMMIGPVNLLSGYSEGLAKLAMDRITKDPAIKTVVLHNALRGFTALNQKTGLIDYAVTQEKITTWVNAYSSAIETLQKAGKRVVFVIDNPTLPDPSSCISGDMTPFAWLNKFIYRNVNPYCTVQYTDHIAGTAPYQNFVKQLQEANSTLFVFDPLQQLCDIPNNICTYAENRNFLYSYGDHISDYAGSKIAKELLPLIRKQK